MFERAPKWDVTLVTSRGYAIRQGARLGIGGAGIAGGIFLLSTNVAAALTTAVGSIPWVPLSANMALLFGSAMFLREFRRARAAHVVRRSDDSAGR